MNGDITTDAIPSPSRSSHREAPGTPDANEKTHPEAFNPEFIDLKKSLPRVTHKIRRNKFPTAQATITNINITGSPGTQIGDTIIYNINKPEKSPKPEIRETSSIKTLKSIRDRVSDDDLSFVASHLDESWQEFARSLGYSDGQVQQFVIDHKHSGIKEVMYQLLLDWYRNEPSEATVGRLCTALWEKGQKEAVKLWSENRKGV